MIGSMFESARRKTVSEVHGAFLRMTDELRQDVFTPDRTDLPQLHADACQYLTVTIASKRRLLHESLTNSLAEDALDALRDASSAVKNTYFAACDRWLDATHSAAGERSLPRMDDRRLVAAGGAGVAATAILRILLGSSRAALVLPGAAIAGVVTSVVAYQIITRTTRQGLIDAIGAYIETVKNDVLLELEAAADQYERKFESFLREHPVEHGTRPVQVT
jgi:hypothetical protein